MAGMRTELNLQADRAGVFPGRSTMFSGDGFSTQKFAVEATNAAGFEAFLAQARAGSETLDQAGFRALAKPTIDGPVRLFSGVEPNLFQAIMSAHGSMPHGMDASARADLSLVEASPASAAAEAHSGHGQ